MQSPRSPRFDTIHRRSSSTGHLTPQVTTTMASPRAASSPARAVTAVATTTSITTSKSSLAFILTDGDHISDNDASDSIMDGSCETHHCHHEYDHRQQQPDALQSVDRGPFVSREYSVRQHDHDLHHNDHHQQHMYIHTHMQHVYRQPIQQSTYLHYDQHHQHRQHQHQLSYAISAPDRRVPCASFPHEPLPEPSYKHIPTDSAGTVAPPRKKGSKFCVVPGCSSRAKHARLCWKHGGSVKCTVPTCSNRAKSKGVCWSHGGGTICSFDDCSTISVSNGVCWAHGGGKRCAIDGCGRPSYERTGNLCSVHFAHSIV